MQVPRSTRNVPHRWLMVAVVWVAGWLSPMVAAAGGGSPAAEPGPAEASDAADHAVPPPEAGTDADGAEAAPDADAAARKAAASQALAHGIELYQNKEYAAALAEFLRSRRLYPARGNTLNAALALRELGRYDEALEMFETLLRDFPSMKPGEKEQVQKALAKMRKRVGSVEIRVDEPGAKVIIAGRERGTIPVPHPLRVSIGQHLVRVVKEGYAPLEVRIDVASGEQVAVEGKLHGLTKSAALKVVEKGGRKATVLVDNVEVGVTPWEGRLALGRHTVVLRGEGELGTQPAEATVRWNEVAALTLELEKLQCSLRVAPTPAGAAVALDGVALGNGLWEGRLRCGKHQLEVAREGFLTARQQIVLGADRPDHVDVVLERDPESELWAEKNPPRIAVEVSIAPALSWSLGGEVSDGCTDACSASVPIGLVASLVGGYQFSFGFGLGVHAGYLQVRQDTTDRPIQATQVPANTALGGTIDDELLLQGALLGGSLWFRRGAQWPLTARLSGGILLGAMGAQRTASFPSADWPLPDQSISARYAYLNPEARVGYGIAKYFELSLVLQAHILFAVDKPTWTQEGDLYFDGLGFVDFPTESLTGDVLVLVTPGLGAALSFY